MKLIANKLKVGDEVRGIAPSRSLKIISEENRHILGPSATIIFITQVILHIHENTNWVRAH